ncbi:MAG: 23S rRNA (cytosine1962-C5)-methyltransferase [Crocinitomicaceae bacterium]|jgi:23S rRNA (cytosine1962-C5)-methyltransferase
MATQRIYATGWDDYELIDAGGGQKLERWGKVITIRPEVQAYFRSGKPFEEWKLMAHWEFIPKSGQTGVWKQLKKKAPEEWTIRYKRLEFNLKLTKFKHVGLFPEQQINWDFIDRGLKTDDSFLNLFAYTGAASCVARYKGANVLHVDSVKQLISWARDNMDQSNLMNIKWVHEDALKFAQREVKRDRKYNGVIMDPPAWGKGANKENWKLEDRLDELVSNAAKLIGEDGFLILNTYTPKIDAAALKVQAELYLSERNWSIRELWMKTTTGKELYYGNVLRVQAEKVKA